MKLLVVLIVVTVMGVTSAEAAARQPYTCEMVRQYVEILGREQLERLGEAYGMTPDQRRAAVKCLQARREKKR